VVGHDFGGALQSVMVSIGRLENCYCCRLRQTPTDF
jgi:hypothetical protein